MKHYVCKEDINEYLNNWITELGKFEASYRKGIVRAIANKIDAMPTVTEQEIAEKFANK